jgi:hypothetical protein
MKRKNNKIRNKRELKKPVPQSLIRKIEKATIGYGKLIEFASLAGLDYNTIHTVKFSKQATDTVRTKIETALKAA